ncbi:MAG: hypothetical protein H6728_16230 [Myxococcales bacterium]|nr:hypothetical protein [Myxococcales bacterium]MCB9644622.1 hypothetical protein [Myxococcales bacterium]
MGALFGFTGPQDLQRLEHIESTLLHRGWGPLARHTTPQGSIALRPRFSESQQLNWGEGLISSNGVTLALSGFLVQRDELASSVRDLPPLPETQGPPRLLHAVLQRYLQQGLSFLEDLHGSFVLAILDGPTLHLARDAAGTRTIYYAQHQGKLYFANEPKGIWSLPGFSRQIRPDALAQYLSFSFIPGEGTMLQGLCEVLPGEVISFHPEGPPRKKRYFCFEDPQVAARYFPDAPEQSAPIEEQEAYWLHAFQKTFAASVAERIVPNHPPSVFLSGGLDSSVVTCELAQQSTKPVHSYAIHFGATYPNELAFARMVAQRCNTRHEEVLIQPKHFVKRLREMIWHLDDPIGDPVTVANYEIAAYVSKTLRWVFNGEGGDPCFGGPKNIPMMMHFWYGNLHHEPHHLERAYLASYRRAYEELPRILSPNILHQLHRPAQLEGLLTPFFQAQQPQRFLHKLTSINIRLKGAHLILPKVERMLGAHGMRPLSPLFDDRLVVLSHAMPPSLLLHRGVEKVVLKRAYEGKLPQPVIQRPKSGMRVPVHFWFQRELRRYAKSLLSPRRLRQADLFQPERVKKLLQYDIEEGQGRYGIRLWMLLTFEIWRSIVIEGETP